MMAITDFVAILEKFFIFDWIPIQKVNTAINYRIQILAGTVCVQIAEEY